MLGSLEKEPQSNFSEAKQVVPSATEPLFKRIIAGMSGQLFQRVVVAAGTVLYVPLMVRAWGAAGYGEWIAISSLASFLGYSNFGFVTPASNEVVMLGGAHDTERARKILQLSISFSLVVILP